MANITRAEVDKINGKLKNGWTFDTWHFMTHQGDKTVQRKIKVDDTHYIIAKLWFSETYKNFKKDGLEITLNISYWENKGEALTSWGLGLFRSIPYCKPRKSFADLEKLTAVIDDNYIMEIYNKGNNSEKCLDNILLDSNGWHLHEV